MFVSIVSPFNKATELMRLEISHIHLRLPVRYGNDQIAEDFPMRVGDVWSATIEIDNGRIQWWPEDRKGRYHLSLKVVDEGQYTLLSPTGEKIAFLADYVPHGMVPGEFGDYVTLEIEDGMVLNWPQNPTPRDFQQAQENC